MEDIQSEWKILRTSVSHSLSRTFVNANPQHGSALSAVFSRLFMWDLDMRRDLMKGDQVEAVYRINDDGLPDIIAARYHSKKSSKTFSHLDIKHPVIHMPVIGRWMVQKQHYDLKTHPCPSMNK